MIEEEPHIYSTRSEIEAVVKRFESCAFKPSEFHHRQHLTVAFWYLMEADEQTALDRMRTGLLRFVDHHKLDPLYHETITLFWLKRLGQAIESCDRDTPLHEQANEVLRVCGNAGLIYTYFSKERLNTDEARSSWVEPDLDGAEARP